MRLSYNFILLGVTAIPGINASSIMSRALSPANLPKGKATQSRQMFDSALDLTSPEAICAFLLLLTVLDPENTDIITCNDDFTLLTFSGADDPTEYCDDKNEFCWANSSTTATISLENLEGLTDVTYKLCTTYTQSGPGDFTELLDKETCITFEGKDEGVSTLFADDETDGGTDEGTDEGTGPEKCYANIGDEECTCTLCDATDDENVNVNLACPTLGFRSEGGCTAINLDDSDSVDSDSVNIIRFTNEPPWESANDSSDDSAAGVVLPSIGLFVILTLASLLA